MTHIRKRLILYALCAALSFSFGARAGNVIVLKEASEINGPSIRLSDVFSGVPTEVDCAIATAPVPGKSVTYDVRVLNALADRYHLDWRPDSLADHATLTRASTRITQDMITAAVLEKMKGESIKGMIEVSFDNRALEVFLPANKPPKFALTNFDYDAVNKRFRSDLLADTGAEPSTLPVTGRIVIKRDVPVLTRRLEAGTTVSKSDLEWMTVADDKINADVITEASQVVGRELRHDTPEGQLLRTRDVIPPRLVTRGSIITLKVQTPYMLITAQGRALQDGTAGDTVRVTNTQSNRVIEGIVDSAGVVRVQTPQRFSLAQYQGMNQPSSKEQ